MAMNIKNLFMGTLVALMSVSASAQEQTVKTVEEFNPHWYIQGQVGAQYTLGELDFGKLISPNAQIAFGRQFSPIFGARLAVNAWQSKGGSEIFGKDYKWKWNYVAPTADFMINVTNLCLGYKYDRVFNFGVFAGIGANFAWNNGEANDVRAQIVNGVYDANNKLVAEPIMPESPEYMEYCENWKTVRCVGRLGLTADFRLSSAVSLGLEVAANFLPDTYNSKRAGNADWYFNALLGVRYNFGATHKTKTITETPCEPRIIERIIERRPDNEFEKKAAPPAPVVKEPLRRDVFFLIASSKISTQEMVKVQEIAEYLKKNPSAKVSVTGYADKGTGYPRINMKYSEQRAKSVAKALTEKFGIPADRITVAFKGDTDQPYPAQKDQVLNRVSICIAE
jgi:outer membrane protein OmpA-like peptidoglycan-associated protein